MSCFLRLKSILQNKVVLYFTLVDCVYGGENDSVEHIGNNNIRKICVQIKHDLCRRYNLKKKKMNVIIQIICYYDNIRE